MGLYEADARMVRYDGTEAVGLDDIRALGDQSLSAITSDVARRQADGSWRYVIDNPFGLALDTETDADADADG